MIPRKKLMSDRAPAFVIGCVALTLCMVRPVEAAPKAAEHVIDIGNTELAVELGADPSPAEKRVTELLAERIRNRTGVKLAATANDTRFRLVIGTVATNKNISALAASRKEITTLGPDGYCIVVDEQSPNLYVVGQSDSGVVAGVGRLMREMRYQQGNVLIPELAIVETPTMPNRGMYLWCRKYYFDQPDKLDRYIEELALWGCNAVAFWFEMGMFESFEDTEGKQSELDTWYAKAHKLDRSLPKDWIAKYQRFYATARRMGMKTGLIMVANDAYMSSPEEMRIKSIVGCPDWYLCPSKSGSVEKMVAWQEQVFQALAPIDIYNIFPADAGGCSCSDCTPWPTRGLWKVAKPLGNRIHEISPKTEIWIDTWHLNHPTFGGKDWMNLVDKLDSSKTVPAWFRGFEVGLAPKHRYAKMAPAEREHYNKAGRPLMVFPDISMWKNHPGMLVKKGYWKSLQNELNSYTRDRMKGGWPYAERWNTDIACVMFMSWFWNPEKSVDTVLDEYASFYFGSDAGTARELLELLDDHCRVANRTKRIHATRSKLEETLPEWVKRDWRWHEINRSCSRFRVE